MDTNIMEQLENKMEIKIHALTDMMLDRFSGVDQKLTVIEQLLKQLINPQNQTGNPTEEGMKVVIEGGDGGPLHESGPNKPLQARIPLDIENQETGNTHEKMCYLTDENMGEKRIELGKNQDEGMKVEIEGGDNGRSRESEPKKPLQAEISSVGEDQQRFNSTDKNTVEEGTECSKNEVNDEFGPKKPSRAEISSNDVDQETHDHIRGPLGEPSFNHLGGYGPPCGWVGLYTQHDRTYNPHGSNYSFGKGFCGPAWVGLQETGFGKKNGPSFGSHEFTFKDQFVNSFVEGCPKTETETGLEGFASKVVNADILKPDQWAEKDSGPLGKALQSETNNESGSGECDKDLGLSALVEAKTDPEHGEQMKVGSKPEGSNECGPNTQKRRQKVKKDSLMRNHFGTKDSWTGLSGEKFVKTGQDGIFKTPFMSDQRGTKKSRMGSWNKWSKDSSKPSGSAECDNGLDWSKLVEAKTDSRHVWGVKRKHPDSSLGGSNDGPISSGPLTATERRVDTFTTDEQETFNEIEPILQSIHRIMHHKGYNDGDHLSADDQTYILENVFNHHPEKAQKMGAGVDYITVDKHMKGSRCFYVVSIDGCKEDFSYYKCLKNFVKKT